MGRWCLRLWMCWKHECQRYLLHSVSSPFPGLLTPEFICHLSSPVCFSRPGSEDHALLLTCPCSPLMGWRLWCFSLHSEQGMQNKPVVQPLGKLRQQDKWYPISKKRKEKRKKRIREEEGGNCGGRRNRTVFYLVTNPSLGSVGVLFSVFCPSD